MSWTRLVSALGVTPDEKGWLIVTRCRRSFVIQRVTIGQWALAVVQTSIAGAARLSTAEAASCLAAFPLGSLVFSDGYWVLRQTLALDGLTVENLELTLRALDYEARLIVPKGIGATGAVDLFAHYAD